MNGKLYTIGATGTQNYLITINNSAVCEHWIDYSYDSAPTHTITFVGDVGLELCSEKKPSFEIKKVHFNDPATVVIWADGTKTVVKCGEEDIYDPQTGLLMCIAKKAFGNKGRFNDILRVWMPEEVNAVDAAVNAFEAFANLMHATLVKKEDI